jgi:signal transduction histidine kinase
MIETPKASPITAAGSRSSKGDDSGSTSSSATGMNVLIVPRPGRFAFLNSLRVRLLASYAVVLLLTLAVIAGALLLLLQARPVPNALILDRLAIGLQTTIQRSLTLPIDRIGKVEDKIVRALTVIANRANFRVLVTDSAGKVRYDSKDYDAKVVFNGAGYKLGDMIAFVEEPYTSTDAPDIALARGTFQDTHNLTWLYVRQLPNIGDSPDESLLIFASQPPRTTLSDILRYYGPDILQPVMEAGIIGLIAAFIFALLIARSVVRPLQQVAAAANALSHGNLEVKAPERGPTEVRAVAAAFNQMTQQVSESQQAQRDFLANVSHDLRTPLTSIQGFSQALIDGVAGNPQSSLRAATIIHDEAARMYRMVEELLDLARIEAGRFAMTRHGVPIGDVVEAVGERLTMTARNKNITLITNVAPQLPIIAGDGDRLAQVFTNLADNALKHTPTGGTVTLRALTQDNGVVISVHDTGEGIPAQDLPHVFERFYQVDKSRQRRDGAGLGLAIAGQIIAAHSGRIWVESEEGAWTQFNVWLPMPNPDGSTILRRRVDAAAAKKQPKS